MKPANKTLSPAKFKRYELKYLITRAQKEELLSEFDGELKADAFGHSTICNLYYDTKDYLLIRRSLNRGVYKEKLRLRSYGLATPEDDVFLELKKKYKGVVYKRRLTIKEEDAVPYFQNAFSLPPSQVADEINYFKKLYRTLQPRMYISYERDAFFGMDDPDFRVTFDENILWRNTDLHLCSASYGHPILPEDYVLMELKVGVAIPLKLAHFLNEHKIYKTSFSKYGRAYTALLQRQQGESHHLSQTTPQGLSPVQTDKGSENKPLPAVSGHGHLLPPAQMHKTEDSPAKDDLSFPKPTHNTQAASNKLNKKEKTYVA